jgi:PPOX class probable F420-dependent enzyme
MSPDAVEAFLDEQRTLQVASINRDGTPHLVAMWFARYRGEIAFWTYSKSQKVVNVKRDPRITVMVESGDQYEELKGVTIYGRARVIDDLDEVFAFGDTVFERYWGPIDSDLIRERVRTMGRKRALIVVERDKTVSWDHTKLGGTY